MSCNRRNRAAVVLLCLLLLPVCTGMAAGEDPDPTVVRVGRFSYPLSLVQRSLNSALTAADALGDAPLTEEEKAQLAEDTVSRFVRIGALQSKLAEAGRNDFTPEETERLKAAASSRYEELYRTLLSRMRETNPDITEEQVSESMENLGYTLDALYLEYELSERQLRAAELFVPQPLLTEAQVRDYYEREFLGPDRERYANDIPLYEREILATDSEAFYLPAGYRCLRQILLAYPAEVTEKLKPFRRAMEAQAEKVTAALAELTSVVTTTEVWSELDAPRAAYDEAVSGMEQARKDWEEEREALTLPLLRETLDGIQARLDAGASFTELIREYSTDLSERNLTGAGYPLHPDSEAWPENYLRAGLALAKPGDVSGPVLTDQGIHILYYAADLPSGERVLTEEEQELLQQSAVQDARQRALTELAETWKDEYETEIHPELLTW